MGIVCIYEGLSKGSSLICFCFSHLPSHLPVLKRRFWSELSRHSFLLKGCGEVYVGVSTTKMLIDALGNFSCNSPYFFRYFFFSLSICVCVSPFLSHVYMQVCHLPVLDDDSYNTQATLLSWMYLFYI